MTFEQTLASDFQRTAAWLAEEGVAGRLGNVIHTTFFATEAAVGEALALIEPLGFWSSYRDTFDDDDFPYWVDVSQEIVMESSLVESSVRTLLDALDGLPFDFNNFAISVDMGDNEEPKFFKP